MKKTGFALILITVGALCFTGCYKDKKQEAANEVYKVLEEIALALEEIDSEKMAKKHKEKLELLKLQEEKVNKEFDLVGRYTERNEKEKKGKKDFEKKQSIYKGRIKSAIREIGKNPAALAIVKDTLGEEYFQTAADRTVGGVTDARLEVIEDWCESLTEIEKMDDGTPGEKKKKDKARVEANKSFEIRLSEIREALPELKVSYSETLKEAEEKLKKIRDEKIVIKTTAEKMKEVKEADAVIGALQTREEIKKKKKERKELDEEIEELEKEYATKLEKLKAEMIKAEEARKKEEAKKDAAKKVTTETEKKSGSVTSSFP